MLSASKKRGAFTLALSCLLISACSSDASNFGSEGNQTGAGSGASSTAGTSSDSSETETSSSAGTDDAGTTSSTGGGGPTSSTASSSDGQTESCGTESCEPDEGAQRECEVVDQNCPPGQKCMPYASAGDLNRDSTHCVEVVADPQPPGAPCTVDDWPASGFDSCDDQSMCFNVDPETLAGTCAAFCDGDSWPYSCEDPLAHCLLANEKLVAVCVRDCDPLKQDCAEGQACYPTESGTYECDWDQSGSEGNYQSACTSHRDCQAGSLCAPGMFVYGCADEACCTDFCALDQEQLDDLGCPDMDKGVECRSLHQPLGLPAPGKQHGACLRAP